MTLSGIVLIVAPHAIVGLYLNLDDPANAATVSLAASLLGIAAVFQIVDGAQTVGSGALRGLKDTRIPMLAATLGYWGIGFPTGYWFAFRVGLGARGLVGPRGRPRQRGRADGVALPSEERVARDVAALSATRREIRAGAMLVG